MENSTRSMASDIFNFMRPKANETKENVIDSSNLVCGPSYIYNNSDTEVMRGTDDDYENGR